MKSIRTAVLAVSMLLAGTSAHAAGAFGVELGEHIHTYAPEAEAVFTRHELQMYELVPPKVDARFDTYAVDTHNGRIIRIMASSADDRTEGAEASLAVLDSLQQELIALYGPPSLSMGEIADAGSELLAHLVDEGGLEVLEWDFLEKRDDGLGAVYVFLAGAEDEKGGQASYCTLYLESPDYAELSETARLHEAEQEERMAGADSGVQQ